MVIEKDAVAESGPITLTLRKIEKGGLISFARQGVRASLYFNKTMFTPGKPPRQVILTAEGLAPVSEPKPAPAKKATAKKKATKKTSPKEKGAKKPRRKAKA
tara:strand:- start:5016 stop:5321 length:306 start_codon:yes stop_codon:yes gene_type:complete